ncbi:MAG: ATP-binding protein, partial [Candidatus Aenigmarchaeota archaeon]|nr:ATP-binding protein [Candidatus Aenigmarchaeota archaeon]
MAFTLTTAEGMDFIDRRKIVKEMFDTLSNKKEKIGFALIGNRRVGKSSILKEVKRKLTRTSVPCIYYSLWNRPEADVEEFSFKLTQLILEEYRSRLGLKYKIKNLISSPIEHIKEVLNDLNISVSLKDLIEINITKREKLHSLDALEDVFKLCDKLEKETGARIIIMLDEFPDIRN